MGLIQGEGRGPYLNSSLDKANEAKIPLGPLVTSEAG